MLRHWHAFSLLVFTLFTVPATAQQPGIAWLNDLEAAKAQAKQSGKLVLVHFWTPSCGPCLALEQTVFNQPSVAAALHQQFVPVKLNADENSATAQWFGITRVPTDVVITPESEIVGKLVSPPTPAGYLAETSALASKYGTRLGQPFANATAAAPMPAQINAAYANLQVPLSTTAATEAAPPTAVQSRFASLIPGAQSTAPTLPPQASYSAATLPIAQQPPTWAVSPGTVANANQAPAPNQVANPHVGLAAAVPPAGQALVVPVAPQPGANRYASVPQIINNPALSNPPAQYVAAAAPVSLNAPDLSKLPSNAPPVGFEGYCPVSMRNTWKWIPGDARYGVVHRGRTYWFAGQEQQQQFWTDPDRYTPALSGMDAVLACDHQQQVPGKREHSLDYDGLFYMFSSEATLQQFTANPQRYSSNVRQAMGIPRGRLVR